MADKPLTEPAEGSPAESSDEPSLSADAVAELQRERDDFHDRWLRKSAEFDNYRKRVDRERREQADQADHRSPGRAAARCRRFRPRADGRRRATAARRYRKGVELIHAKLNDILRKRGVRPIEALGTDFDPNLHQAVIHETSPDHREGEVIGELRRGYVIGDKLLRPAMVKVAKA